MTGRSPNVLLLLSDEQSWNTLGCNGNPAARTPHLDRLAEEGTSFDRMYTPFPLCCPSRTSMLTARMPRHHHVLGNWRGINPELAETGLGRVFADAGFHTAYVGKWHVPGTTPQRMGFTATAAIPAVLNGKDRGRFIPDYREFARGQGYDLLDDHIENLTAADVATLKDPTSPHRGTAEIAEEHFLETWQTTELIKTIDEAPADRPWFTVCSYNAPHFPLLPPAPYDQLIDRDRVRLPDSFATGHEGLPPEVSRSHFAQRFADLDEDGWVDAIAHYYGLCSLVDTQVGRILQHLERIGELDRTIIVFTADHGDLMGAHRLMEKGHLLPYEEAIRLPMIIRHPDGGSVRIDRMLSMVDLGPTLADLASLNDDHGFESRSHGPDGRSFADQVGNRDPSPIREFITTESVLWNMDSEDAFGEHRDPATFDPDRDAINLSVRTTDLHYIFRSRDIDELFDMDADPGQTVNRASEQPKLTADLRQTLATEVADVFSGVPPV